LTWLVHTVLHFIYLLTHQFDLSLDEIISEAFTNRYKEIVVIIVSVCPIE